MTDEEKAAQEAKEKAEREKAERLAAEKGETVPRTRLNTEIEKRKAAEAELKEVAKALADDIPEEYRSLVPVDLPPGKLITWIREAMAKGLFDPKAADGPDPKRAKGKVTEDLSTLSPYSMMEKGYGKS